MKGFSTVITVLAAALLASGSASGQDFPNKPIRLIVPFAAGGATDILARPLAQGMAQVLNQQVIVDNRGGGNSIIGTSAVAKAAPDGYTLLVNAASHTLFPFYLKNVPYDAVKDFTPIAATGMSQRVIVVHPSLPVNSIRELVSYAKANPGKLSYAVAASGSIQELAGDWLRVTAGVEIVPVSYKGGGPAMTDLLGGHVQMAILVLPDMLQHIRSGKLRALGIVEARRSKLAPEIPTVSEAGIPGYAIPEQWVGVLGPAGMPNAIVMRLNEAINQALLLPVTRTALESRGYEIMGGPPSELGNRMLKDVETYRRFTTTVGVVPK